MEMAAVLAQFAEPLSTSDGWKYLAQACGSPNASGLWEGWIEFVPANGGPALRSGRETTQPNKTDAEYWATGLTTIYLEGALARALNPPTRKAVVLSHPPFDGPARRGDAILDPFSVFEKGETILRKELGALATWHLVNIVTTYQLSEEPMSVLNLLSAQPLIEIIIVGVRSRSKVSGSAARH
jgi:hypothetical protein